MLKTPQSTDVTVTQWLELTNGLARGLKLSSVRLTRDTGAVIDIKVGKTLASTQFVDIDLADDALKVVALEVFYEVGARKLSGKHDNQGTPLLWASIKLDLDEDPGPGMPPFSFFGADIPR